MKTEEQINDELTKALMHKEKQKELLEPISYITGYIHALEFVLKTR